MADRPRRVPWACAPGIPSIAEQEKSATGYRRAPTRPLWTWAPLRVAEGLRVQPPGQLIAAAREEWGALEQVICDRFRLGELMDVVDGCPVVPRVSRWSEAAFDIRSLRRLSKDGPLSVAESSRPLLAASLAAAMVKGDDQGNTRLTKRAANNESRDDVGAALVLASGSFARSLEARPRRGSRYRGAA